MTFAEAFARVRAAAIAANDTACLTIDGWHNRHERNGEMSDRLEVRAWSSNLGRSVTGKNLAAVVVSFEKMMACEQAAASEMADIGTPSVEVKS
jgi:hypothetical protein